MARSVEREFTLVDLAEDQRAPAAYVLETTSEEWSDSLANEAVGGNPQFGDVVTLYGELTFNGRGPDMSLAVFDDSYTFPDADAVPTNDRSRLYIDDPLASGEYRMIRWPGAPGYDVSGFLEEGAEWGRGDQYLQLPISDIPEYIENGFLDDRWDNILIATSPTDFMFIFGARVNPSALSADLTTSTENNYFTIDRGSLRPRAGNFSRSYLRVWAFTTSDADAAFEGIPETLDDGRWQETRYYDGANWIDMPPNNVYPGGLIVSGSVPGSALDMKSISVNGNIQIRPQLIGPEHLRPEIISSLGGIKFPLTIPPPGNLEGDVFLRITTEPDTMLFRRPSNGIFTLAVLLHIQVGSYRSESYTYRVCTTSSKGVSCSDRTGVRSVPVPGQIDITLRLSRGPSYFGTAVHTQRTTFSGNGIVEAGFEYDLAGENELDDVGDQDTYYLAIDYDVWDNARLDPSLTPEAILEVS